MQKTQKPEKAAMVKQVSVDEAIAALQKVKASGKFQGSIQVTTDSNNPDWIHGIAMIETL